MPSRSLRLFNPADQESRRERELDLVSGVSEPKLVSVPLAKLVPWLIDATERNHTWLNDFADDNVQIESDLYDVLLAFQNIRAGEAA